MMASKSITLLAEGLSACGVKANTFENLMENDIEWVSTLKGDDHTNSFTKRPQVQSNYTL